MIQTWRSWVSDLSLTELRDKYRKKEVSPTEAVRTLLDKIEESQETLNSFITICAEQALEQARLSEKRYLAGEDLGPLDGIPYGAKDIIFTKSIPTTMGCSYYQNYLPRENAAVIESLHLQGAVLLGKTNTQQFALGATGDRSFTGPTHNPWNLQKIPGGSSSGSAAAVAAGLCPFAIATDTGGSARVPAALCGVTGMKPTRNRISTRGVFPASTTYDTVGVLTRTVSDNALVLSATACYDRRDPLSLALPEEDFCRLLDKPLKGTVIHVPWERILRQTEPEIEKRFLEALQLLEARGAVIREMRFPDYSEYRNARTKILLAEAYAVHRELFATHPEVYSDDAAADLENGKKITAFEYIDFLKMHREFSLIFRDLMENVEIMAYPSTSIPATDIDFRGSVEVNGTPAPLYEALSRFNWFSSMSGYPALAVPDGFAYGLPAGIQFTAHPGDEARLYQTALQLEYGI